MKTKSTLTLFRAPDVICIALTVALSMFFLFFSQIIFTPASNSMLKIEANGETEYHSLNENQILNISSNNHTLTITVLDGCAWISYSDCSDGTCRHMGKINKNGQMAICAPAQVAISVQNTNTEEEVTDAITR